jgi:hypothetical protein
MYVCASNIIQLDLHSILYRASTSYHVHTVYLPSSTLPAVSSSPPPLLIHRCHRLCTSIPVSEMIFPCLNRLDTLRYLPDKPLCSSPVELTPIQHTRLAPAPAAHSGNPSIHSSSSARLGEFFDLIKSEFDQVSQDGNIWKDQRDQYEAKC